MSLAKLEADLEATRATLEDEVRRLEERIRSLDHDLRAAVEARCQGLASELNRWHESLLDKVGARELSTELQAAQTKWEGADERLETGFRAEVVDLKNAADRALERLRTELIAIHRSRAEEPGRLAAQVQSPVPAAPPGPPEEPADRPKTIGIKEYIDSFNSSSARARGAVYVVAVASLVVFSTFWNVHPGSWLQERARVAREIEALVKKREDAQSEAQKKADAQPEAQKKADASRVAGTKPADAAESERRAAADGDADERIHRVLLDRVIEHRRLDWPGAARTYREKLEDLLYVQAYQVRIPFFGVTYDINDLGMFGGFAFFVVLMILRFSLARELANLRLAFREAAARGQVDDCFKLLSMGQVLTVPRHTDVTSNVFNRNLHRFLYILPVLILGMIMWHDITSLKSGLVFSTFNTVLTLIFSAGFFIINIILTYQCLDCSYRADKTWTRYGPDAYARVSPGPPGGAGASHLATSPAPKRTDLQPDRARPEGSD
jgi:hypothetical protein